MHSSWIFSQNSLIIHKIFYTDHYKYAECSQWMSIQFTFQWIHYSKFSVIQQHFINMTLWFSLIFILMGCHWFSFPLNHFTKCYATLLLHRLFFMFKDVLSLFFACNLQTDITIIKYVVSHSFKDHKQHFPESFYFSK